MAPAPAPVMRHPVPLPLQGLLNKLTHSKAAASGQGLPPDDAAALLEAVLFIAAREADRRTAAAAAAAFRYLLHVAQGAEMESLAEPVSVSLPTTPAPDLV